ncbi:helix-turn-helix domain-containing protein [Loigolactobacillus rennini]|uniref:HTH cro/C1-type domain-containing protein n=1 Tax=Loigolactobacillus rennini DSM 20253 TaxID=1423796 RepID=A0A0R2DDB6_9LACO|nr:helix-turn-helix transcriptional regulator [Loigolactobacillus rennini]KRM98790.1 hypothetical protein FC24_GL001026 [Loigolactobacillus rennini DSM 20253]
MAQNKIAQQIQSLRTKRDWTQDQLAERLGVSKQSVSNWETGLKSPRMGALQKMADIFHVSIGYITDGDDFDQSIDQKITILIKKLNKDRKQRVFNFINTQLYEQEKEDIFNSPNALAAHADNIDQTYSNKDIKKRTDFLEEEIKKYNRKNGK